MKTLINVVSYFVILVAMYFTFAETYKFLVMCAEKTEISIIVIIIGFVFWIAVMSILAFILTRMKDWIELKYKKKINTDNVPEKFSKLYNSLYYENIKELEKIRKKLAGCILLRNISLYVVILINLIYFGLDVTIINTKIYAFIIICELSIITAFFGNYKVKGLRKEYTETYKKIIPKFIELINPKLKYTAISNKSKLLKEYEVANFDGLMHNRHYEDDYIEGEIAPGITAQIADVLIEYEKAKDSKTTLFSGVFATCRSSLNFENEYVKINVNKNNKEIKSKDTKVEMDNSEFEKYFDVYSENKILAMRILTADIMEIIMEFYNKYNLFFEIVYRNNNIYLRFFTGKVFEPDVWKKSLDFKSLYEYYEIIKFIIKVTEKSNKIIEGMEL